MGRERHGAPALSRACGLPLGPAAGSVGSAMAETREPKASWEFDPGTAVGRGRTAVRLLGGGDRYEAWLGWDDHLCTTVVLKMLLGK